MMRKLSITIIKFAAFSLFVASLCTAQAAKIREGHVIPTDKKLSKDAVKRFYERGKQQTYQGKDLDTIGMPVGGIAAGQIYLRGDGTPALWQIFNKHVFSGYGSDNYRTYRPDSPVDSGFAVVVESNGKTIAKPLDRDFGTVEFTGEYPIGIVRYKDNSFPVKIEMEAFSPFIPLNAKDSALPATLFHITVENTSNRAVEAGILGWLENAVLIDSAKSVLAQRRSQITTEKNRTLIVHTAEKAPPPEDAPSPRPKIVLADFEGPDYGDWKAEGQAFGAGPAHGTLPDQNPVSGFLGKGLVNTYLGGDGPHGTLTSPPFEISRKFINFLIGGGNHINQTCINLIIDDKVVRTAVGKSDEKLEWYFWDVEEFQGKQAQIKIVDKASGGWGHINIDQIELSDKPEKVPSGPVDKLPDFGSLALAFDVKTCSPSEASNIIASAGD
ncbi:MAG: GH116 family glycosyl-hydrolase, partial [Phycisphaerae bacterium]|nr:GH116 family glycosyl-hydrolase [Phycisphaerae bacterium]